MLDLRQSMYLTLFRRNWKWFICERRRKNAGSVCVCSKSMVAAVTESGRFGRKELRQEMFLVFKNDAGKVSMFQVRKVARHNWTESRKDSGTITERVFS